jgi:acetyl esterase/lipase
MPDQPLPVIVYIHGSGWQSRSKDSSADLLWAVLVLPEFELIR